MRDMNKVFLVGRLGKNPEVKGEGEKGKRASFSLATSRGYLDKVSGQWSEITEWHRVVAWGKMAEICQKHLQKGDPVCIEGRIQHSIWKDDKGLTRSATDIVAEQVRFFNSASRERKEAISTKVG